MAVRGGCKRVEPQPAAVACLGSALPQKPLRLNHHHHGTQSHSVALLPCCLAALRRALLIVGRIYVLFSHGPVALKIAAS